MKIKNILSAVTAVCMAFSMVCANVAEAAEKTLAPWSVYFAERTNNDNFIKWVAAPETFDSNGYYAANGSNEVILRTQSDGRIFVRTAADANGYKSAYGAPAIGFSAPTTGKYKIEFTSVQEKNQPHNLANIASATFGVVDGDDVNVFESVGLHGYNVAETDTIKQTTELTTTVDLNADDILTAKISSSVDGYLRMFYITYKITDLTTGITYNFNDIGRTTNAPVSSDKNVYDIGEYNHAQAVDHSMWSVYLTSNVDSDTWNDMSTWTAYPIESYRNADNKNVLIKSGTTEVSFYDNRPNGWFYWRPAGDGESQGKGTFVIGWTAPEAGVYAFDFSVFNYGTDVKGGEPLVHKIAYLEPGETEPVLIERFSTPSARDAQEGSKKYQLKVKEGETIFFMNDSGTDGFGDCADIRLVITDIKDASKTWSASDIGKATELTNSPFSLWKSYHNWGTVDTDIRKYIVADIEYQPDTGNVVTNKWNPPYFMIKPDGRFETIPSGTSGYNNAVMFDVPEDGFYRADFSATNINTEATDVENAYAALYKLSGRTTDIGTALAKSAPIKKNGVYSNFSQVVAAKKGDKILLNVNTNTDAWMLRLEGTYSLTKLDQFNYRYLANGNIIESLDEIEPGDELEVILDYVDNKQQNIMILLGLFNKEGTMISLGLSDEITARASEAVSLSASVTIPEDMDGVVAKAFVVDGINSLAALDDPNVLE